MTAHERVSFVEVEQLGLVPLWRLLAPPSSLPAGVWVSIAGSDHDEMNDDQVLIADAMATFDGEQVADALLEAVQRALSPLMFAGFTLGADGSVELRRFRVDPGWGSGLPAEHDFRWVEPLLGVDAENGASIIGPDVHGASQIAAVMALGKGRFGYFVVVGQYADPETARKRLSRIATAAGRSTQTMRKANERAADSAALRERERLSRDLHDSLSQSLWSLSMLSETAHSMIDPDDPLHSVIHQITDISLSSQEEMRRLLINLRTPPMERRESIATTLESLVADFRASHDVEVIASIAHADLDPDSLMAFRRIAEEALNNVGRHADASVVVVMFDADPVLSLRIGDNGAGFDGKPLKGHLGLRIMKERAEEAGCEFDVSSFPGGGTVITAARDLSQTRPMNWREPPPATPSMRAAGWFLVAGLVVAALSVGMFLISRSNRSGAESVQSELDIATVLHERVFAGRATADEATARILEGVGMVTANDVAAATAARDASFVDGLRAVEPLAEPGSLSGEYALQFLDELDRAAVIDPADNRVDRLYFDMGLLEGPGAQPDPLSTMPIHSLGNLASLNEVVTFTLLESVMARYAMAPDAFDPSPSVRDFFEFSIDIVRNEGGYLGPDATAPLSAGFIPTEIAMVHEGGAVDELNAIVADAALWEDDRWVRDWTESAEPPPTGLAAYVERSTMASAEMRVVIDSRFDAHRFELLATRDADRRSATLFAVGAGLLLVLSLISLLLSLRTVVRRYRVLAIDNARDSLTGIGNRTLLQTAIAPRLSDPLLSHHLMVTLDMDRFKITNDVHGHGFGDRVLEVVGSGLEAMTTLSPTVEGVAVRIGGDEFLISFHSASEIPIDAVHRGMNRLRSTFVSAADGTLVRCSFSYGVVAEQGAPDLMSMMAGSDLAAYEEKSRRDAARLKA